MQGVRYKVSELKDFLNVCACMCVCVCVCKSNWFIKAKTVITFIQIAQ